MTVLIAYLFFLVLVSFIVGLVLFLIKSVNAIKALRVRNNELSGYLDQCDPSWRHRFLK